MRAQRLVRERDQKQRGRTDDEQEHSDVENKCARQLHVANEPQPDIMLLRPRADFYRAHIPGPADVLLVVEVAESSAALDRRVKLPLYARSGIPEVWLVDLGQETIGAYRDPSPDGYRTAQTFRRGERLSPAAFPELELAVAEILGES